jgi:hypothetical protein
VAWAGAVGMMAAMMGTTDVKSKRRSIQSWAGIEYDWEGNIWMNLLSMSRTQTSSHFTFFARECPSRTSHKNLHFGPWPAKIVVRCVLVCCCRTLLLTKRNCGAVS